MCNDPAAVQDAVIPQRRRERRSPASQLRTALLGLSQGHGELLSHHERPWASVTFSGAHHTLGIEFSGTEAIAAGEQLIATVPEHEFAIPRQLVADVAVVSVEHTTLPAPRLVVTLEVLMLEDC
jgi:hypothetical protein